ncbi:hypothetical protein SPBRAN_1469 [uncultured Candidatus Thioglobus sp.]|nr:hypothetical protein SPBRAN_1469 [uncultured Candidatus Thioglobus sp.]
MSDFFANIWTNLNLLGGFDWLIIVILVGFLVLGIRRGLIKELINLGFLILAILIAWKFYQWLADTPIITWLALSEKSHLAVAFGALFVGVLTLKKALYKLTASSVNTSNPCALNRTFVLVLFVIIAALESQYYLDSVVSFGILQSVVSSQSSLTILSFIVVFGFVVVVGLSLVKLFNISIDSSKPCLLAPFFRRILNALQSADTFLNARNVNSSKNQIFGAIFGLIKGFLAVLIMVLVLQNIDWVSQQYYWVESKSVLGIFQQIVAAIKPELSQYLLFINHN